ncbi:MAG: response regulator [Flavobacterium sp.]
MIQVVHIDDHTLIRKSLKFLIDLFEGIEVVFETDNDKELIDFLEKNKADILLLDIQMPNVDGYELCKIIKNSFPELKILVVSQLTTREAVSKIMEYGAHGFFTKNAHPEQLEEAIISVMEKDYYFDMTLSGVLKEAMNWENKNVLLPIQNGVELTPKEIETIKWASLELSSKEIAEKMYISVNSVDKHRKNILTKTGCKNFLGVVLWALKHQIITLEEIIE